MNFGFFRISNTYFCIDLPAVTVVALFAYAQEAEFIWSRENGSGTEIILSSYKDGAWQTGESVS